MPIRVFTQPKQLQTCLHIDIILSFAEKFIVPALICFCCYIFDSFRQLYAAEECWISQIGAERHTAKIRTNRDYEVMTIMTFPEKANSIHDLSFSTMLRQALNHQMKKKKPPKLHECLPQLNTDYNWSEQSVYLANNRAMGLTSCHYDLPYDFFWERDSKHETDRSWEVSRPDSWDGVGNPAIAVLADCVIPGGTQRTL